MTWKVKLGLALALVVAASAVGLSAYLARGVSARAKLWAIEAYVAHRTN